VSGMPDPAACARHPGYPEWECQLLGPEECPERGLPVPEPAPGIHPAVHAAAVAGYYGTYRHEGWEAGMFAAALQEAARYDDPDGQLAGAVTGALRPLLPDEYGEHWDRTASGCAHAAAESIRQHAAGIGLRLRPGRVPDIRIGVTWTLAEVSAHIGAGSPGSARRALSRWGVAPIGRLPGRAGQSLYDRGQVEAARAARPGRGHRSDLPRVAPGSPE
jgi:hypothetical protein